VVELDSSASDTEAPANYWRFIVIARVLRVEVTPDRIEGNVSRT
jgi:hypothetical protein